MDSETHKYGPGDKIGHSFDITIVDRLGEGGMGIVYEAQLRAALGFEKRVALKFVRPGKHAAATGPNTGYMVVSRLVEEAKLVSNLIHTHIVQIYLLGIVEKVAGRPDAFIAMEYVHGANVRAFLDRHISENRSVPVEIAVYIASRIARALEYAHTRLDKSGKPLGIVHRDVTPTNILISADGVVKLTDFGIATVVIPEAFDKGYVVGKRLYMAPEQLAAERVDFRADIYSLGLVLYEMLTTQIPQSGAQIRKNLNARGIPPRLIELIERSIQSNPGDRFAGTGEFATELEKIIYEKGYGPTFITMGEYIRGVFPSLGNSDGPPPMETEGATMTLVEVR